MIDPVLESAIRSAWSAATAAGDAPWSPANPSAGDLTARLLAFRTRVDEKLVSVRAGRAS